jgi:DNA (cytosine-5)-methyltransferase 1
VSFGGREPLPTIDLFAGAGGLSLGLRDADFDVVAASEWNRDACDTYAKHHPGSDLIDGDLARISFRPWRGHVVLVAGGPPCQPWSTGGKRLGTSDPRDGFPHFLRVLREVQPPAFLIENVSGLARGARLSYLEALVRALEDLAYKVSWKVVNAADFGVPQKRHRLFVVGTRIRKFEFPKADYGPGARYKWQPAGKVLRRRLIIGEGNDVAVTYAKSPDLRPDPYDGLVYNGGGRPIDLSRPAPTILAASGGNKTPWIDTEDVVVPYHGHLSGGGAPRDGRVPGARRLTVAEAALLQTFKVPERHGCHGVVFAGSRSSQYTQVGNAVPPRLAATLGRALRKHMDAHEGASL